MLLGVAVDVLAFLTPLRPVILVLSPMRPFIEPLFVVVPLPRCIRPSGVVPGSCWGDVVMLPLLVVVVFAGVIWAKAVVLRKRVQAAATRILMVFMIL